MFDILYINRVKIYIKDRYYIQNIKSKTAWEVPENVGCYDNIYLQYLKISWYT